MQGKGNESRGFLETKPESHESGGPWLNSKGESCIEIVFLSAAWQTC